MSTKNLIHLIITFLLAFHVKSSSPPSSAHRDITVSSSATDIKTVIELTSRNFDSYISDGNVWLIEFYAPWCGHCKRFAPVYEQVAIKLHSLHASTNRKIMVGRVNGAVDKALSSRFSITKYPSFFLIDGWTVREYDGNRSLENLIDFATKSFKNYEPIPFLQSPFGPVGQVKMIMMYVGTKVLEAHEVLVKRGFSAAFAAMVLGSFGIFIGIVAVITIGLLTVQKPKVD